jgi:hypothetical protein
MPTRQDFKLELHRIMNEAIHQGKATADMNAGDLHKRVGGYPGKNHRMPVCCGVMRGSLAPDVGDVILQARFPDLSQFSSSFAFRAAPRSV